MSAARSARHLLANPSADLLPPSLDPTRPAPDLKEGFNLGFMAQGSPPVPTQPIPALFQPHAEKLAEFQYECFSFCQQLLEAFAIALDVSWFQLLCSPLEAARSLFA